MNLSNFGWIVPRRRSVLSGIVAVVVSLCALPAGSGEPVGATVVEDSPERTLIEYSFGQHTATEVKIGGQAHLVVGMEHETRILRAGAPDVPNVCRSIVIADDAAVSVKVVDSNYYELTDIALAPSKGSLSRQINPADVPFTFDQKIYGTDAFYPGTLAELSEPYIMRDIRGVVVRVNPFQYNPATKVLRVYTTMKVEVSSAGKSDINAMRPGMRKGELSRAFHNLYKNHFLNYGTGLKYDPLDELGEMLVICHDAWLSNMTPFVDHKNGIGINTTIVGVSTVGNSGAAIKSYIQGVYDTSDLAFVLLVGDVAQVATMQSGGASDPSYSKLAGSDDYPDIMVGRFSASTAAHVDTQVERTVEYENMPATQQDWFWKGVGIASAEGAGIGDEGQSDIQHENEIRGWLLDAGYTEVDQIYDPGASASAVSVALNAGRGVLNYTGHGWEYGISSSGFDVGDVNALTNDNELPFVILVACLPGAFADVDECMGEAWLRATNGGEPTGAIGCYASTINQTWAEPMEGQDEFNLLLAAGEPYHSLGTLCYAGSCSMMDAYGGAGRAMFDTWTLFGDPSVCIIGTVEPPTGLAVAGGSFASSGQLGGPFTPDSKTYTLTNHAGFAIDYSVTGDATWVDIANASGTLSPAGVTDVVVSHTSAVYGLGGGTYSGTLTFTNLTNHDGDTTRDVSLYVDARMLQYAFNMDTDPGWTAQGQWAWGQPTGGGGNYGNPDPTSGATGPNVYGYNLNGDYSTNMPEYHLTTTAIDCSELTETTLKFQRYLNVEQPTYDHAYIRVSNDGTAWTTIWENTSVIEDNAWREVEFDISGHADNQPTVYLRWTMGTTDGSWQYSGWNIDDVEIWGASAAGCAADINNDGLLTIEDITALIDAFIALDPAADINDDGVINIGDITAFIDAFVAGC